VALCEDIIPRLARGLLRIPKAREGNSLEFVSIRIR
jgi:hypothetical protein